MTEKKSIKIWPLEMMIMGHLQDGPAIVRENR